MKSAAYRVPWTTSGADQENALVNREWLVTNGLGGYASGTLLGLATRRYHGLLIAALPSPLGRTMMFNHLIEEIRLPSKQSVLLAGNLHQGDDELIRQSATTFYLEWGLPVWRYEVGAYHFEKRIIMQHRSNTMHLIYQMIEGPSNVSLSLRPGFHFRGHEMAVGGAIDNPYGVYAAGNRIEIIPQDLPHLRLQFQHPNGAFSLDGGRSYRTEYSLERARGYPYQDTLWSPGTFHTELKLGETTSLVASTEPWDAILAISSTDALNAEHERRVRLVEQAPQRARDGFPAELVLAADQFIVAPVARVADTARAHASGEEPRSVIAGYHWFTDWGRDTMISLEGLTLCTGRHVEAEYILRTFSLHVRDGLLPNLFPEGGEEGLYHTADATLWYFHAIDRYLQATGDGGLLRSVLPTLQEIVDRHLAGTRFGIGVDREDGLLRQGEPGYQLTWMDAKVGDWVVTPRRGKAVEINALWFNALTLMKKWLDDAGQTAAAQQIEQHARRVFDSFNRRFWSESHGWLYDVIDGKNGDDASLRPNQILAISLPHPVLVADRWTPVLNAIEQHLLTPVGLRTLAPFEPDYKAKYDGDLYARDAAYHQGTAWAWLIGPYVDALLKTHGRADVAKRDVLKAFPNHLGDACVGSISEIFDAEPPYHPRGCAAQAWSVAEVLRAWLAAS